jgi:hypothetical protein
MGLMFINEKFQKKVNPSPRSFVNILMHVDEVHIVNEYFSLPNELYINSVFLKQKSSRDIMLNKFNIDSNMYKHFLLEGGR